MRSNHSTVTVTSTIKPRGDATGWLGALQQDRSAEELSHLPDSLTDPFANLANRLAAVCDSFRFSTEARSLTAWAVAQTGMADPLTKYSRQELEEAFGRYAHKRQMHLQDLVRQIKRQHDPSLLTGAMRSAVHAEARRALQRAMRL